MKKTFLALMACMACVMFGSCSEDKDDYESKLPVFSDIVFDTETITAGDYVTATAVQHKLGKLLDNTTYYWKLDDPTAHSTLQYNNAVIYPHNSTNPSCKFRAPELPGTYTITFSGQYSVSGQAGNSSSMAEIAKGTVKYEYTPLKAYVTVTKKFKVVKSAGN